MLTLCIALISIQAEPANCELSSRALEYHCPIKQPNQLAELHHDRPVSNQLFQLLFEQVQTGNSNYECGNNIPHTRYSPRTVFANQLSADWNRFIL